MNYHNITKNDYLQGDGVRVALWVAGCSHHCKGCHNPETWDENGGIPFDNEAKKELFKALNKPYIDGITYTGGDPLYPANTATITKLAKEIRKKFPDKTQWLYTGFSYEDIKDLEIMKYLDVVAEGPYIEELRSPDLPWVGSSNQRVIRLNNQKS